MLRAESPLRFLKGVGPRRAATLAGHGLDCLEDLLYVLPFRYEDRRAFGKIADLSGGSGATTLLVRVQKHVPGPRIRRSGFSVFKVEVEDDSGSIRAVWYNQPYLERLLVVGRQVVLYGRARVGKYDGLVLENPEYELQDEDDTEAVHMSRVVPVYRKLGDLHSRGVRRLMHRAFAELDLESLPQLVPQEILDRYSLLPRVAALQQTHFPADDVSLTQLDERRSPAQRSLAFEEMFLLQLALGLRRHGVRQASRGIAYQVPDALRTRLAQLLPFKLTAAQRRVLREIGTDLRSTHPMHRLLQGDVGSGKTIVAALTLLVAVENGYQAALMAPTEILAEQHFRTLSRLLGKGAVACRTRLLTGSLKSATRRDVLEGIASGDVQLAVGTHALFEQGVEFRRLGLVVVDEQHRFGVLQRQALARKGTRPDVLVMTATPIPRSLALTIYGDLDLSVIDELPPGRRPVRTAVRGEQDRPALYAFLLEEIERGRQVYFVVPLVEETERSDLKAAKAFVEQLRGAVFPADRVGLLHGRMKGADKEQVMGDFAAGRLAVLVATTVIEVGVDVPNATVMVIEHAERFGLSQLHQLRGRVGRGANRSFCALMIGDGGASEEARQRLEVMESTQDGFRIAQRDLELRGPGAVFGTQQHGLSDLQFLAVVLKAPELLEAARLEAQRRIDAGPEGRSQVRELLDGLRERWRRRLELAEVG